MRTSIVAMLAAVGALMVPASAAAADPTCDWTPSASTSVTEGHTGTTQASIDLCPNPTTHRQSTERSMPEALRRAVRLAALAYERITETVEARGGAA